ncbi:N-acetylmuramoyl-L-alanine amidase [Actinophytocola xinjiangensis]|uniref:N-acetylmuramoyl-L-alanine amidase n=1 Tax=Actinophytocola xinjiangensis TaxID=485602 RepID=A0A7Z0WIC4_9PSEU|nr:N-acetylmuramoyl-L-alanine amidase [Actinophytocola xinjiangensis]
MVTSVFALAACGATPAATVRPTATTTRSPVSTAPPATTTAPAPARRVVVLDPGHNGANAANPGRINRRVPAGRGRTKACNTTGTATDAGYPEHRFTWAVSTMVRELLVARGVEVRLTRPSDDGIGPCVDERAAVGNRAGADAVVSIHADGSTSPSAKGFHVAYSAPPLNAAQGEPSRRLAESMRDALRARFPVSTYIGDAGLSPRDDLGGLNLSTRPAVLVECGNMRNATEAGAFSSPDGQRAYASAIADGILAYLA